MEENVQQDLTEIILVNVHLLIMEWIVKMVHFHGFYLFIFLI